ncbi:hypothetical protein GCM10029976_035590 [Kribbella albertanoniae]
MPVCLDARWAGVVLAVEALYRTLQEALANTRKHAVGASAVAALEYGGGD